MPDIVKTYFDAFNAKDMPALLDCLSEDVAHHVNEGTIRHGKLAFAEFCTHMSLCYDEHLTNMVLFSSSDPCRRAAEYIVNGRYLVTDEGLPDAAGQTYQLPAGSFFEINETGKISRVTTMYNLTDWMDQVVGTDAA